MKAQASARGCHPTQGTKRTSGTGGPGCDLWITLTLWLLFKDSLQPHRSPMECNPYWLVVTSPYLRIAWLLLGSLSLALFLSIAILFMRHIPLFYVPIGWLLDPYIMSRHYLALSVGYLPRYWFLEGSSIVTSTGYNTMLIKGWIWWPARGGLLAAQIYRPCFVAYVPVYWLLVNLC